MSPGLIVPPPVGALSIARRRAARSQGRSRACGPPRAGCSRFRRRPRPGDLARAYYGRVMVVMERRLRVDVAPGNEVLTNSRREYILQGPVSNVRSLYFQNSVGVQDHFFGTRLNSFLDISLQRGEILADSVIRRRGGAGLDDFTEAPSPDEIVVRPCFSAQALGREQASNSRQSDQDVVIRRRVLLAAPERLASARTRSQSRSYRSMESVSGRRVGSDGDGSRGRPRHAAVAGQDGVAEGAFLSAQKGPA